MLLLLLLNYIDNVVLMWIIALIIFIYLFNNRQPIQNACIHTSYFITAKTEDSWTQLDWRVCICLAVNT